MEHFKEDFKSDSPYDDALKLELLAQEMDAKQRRLQAEATAVQAEATAVQAEATAKPYLDNATAMLQQGQFGEAVEEINKVLHVSPLAKANLRLIHAQRADHLLRGGHPECEQVILLLTPLEAKGLMSGAAYHALAQANRRLGRLDAAAKAIAKAIVEEPTNSAHRLESACIWLASSLLFANALRPHRRMVTTGVPPKKHWWHSRDYSLEEDLRIAEAEVARLLPHLREAVVSTVASLTAAYEYARHDKQTTVEEIMGTYHLLKDETKAFTSVDVPFLETSLSMPTAATKSLPTPRRSRRESARATKSLPTPRRGRTRRRGSQP